MPSNLKFDFWKIWFWSLKKTKNYFWNQFSNGSTTENYLQFQTFVKDFMQFGKKDLLNIFNWYTQWIDLDAGHPCKTLFFFLIMHLFMIIWYMIEIINVHWVLLWFELLTPVYYLDVFCITFLAQFWFVDIFSCWFGFKRCF